VDQLNNMTTNTRSGILTAEASMQIF